ncbi:MAG: Flp pilus assembly complex ATPase component TadA [Planctomycetales bacterium]|nr:Flp pilus assembly complex ATPase component TadA [Planctomycetales bacterium]
MSRLLLLVIVFAVGASADVALAQDAEFPSVPFTRGDGFYLSWIKLATFWLLFLGWVATVSWINADAHRHGNRPTRWNAAAVFPFALMGIVFFFLPTFWASLPLLAIAYLVPTIWYVIVRNGRLDPHQRVMTPSHIRFLLLSALNKVGGKFDVEARDPHEKGPPVHLTARGGATERDDTANMLLARQSPGLLFAREILYEAFERRAETVMMDFSQEAVTIRYQIDGVWHNGEPRDRETGDMALAVMKQISALDPNQRRQRQEGEFGANWNGTKYTATFVSQGTKTGERAIVRFDDGVLRFAKLADLGMREKVREQLQTALGENAGFVLFSAPTGNGLKTTISAAMGSMDRYMRSFALLEDLHHPCAEVDNVPVTTFDGAAGETPATVLPKLLRLYPEVICVRELTDGETAKILSVQPAENRMVVAGVRAKDVAEAMIRVLMLKIAPAKLASIISAVVNVRLVRRLCETCKEGYAPPPKILQQLGIPAGKVEAFYRPPQEPDRVCPDCGGIGYIGRAAVFEVLFVDDAVRTALAKTPKLDVLRAAARKAGTRNLQQEGLFLVVKGVTSIQELSRALKE